MDGANAIALPKAFTRDEIPGSKGEIPCPELCRTWKHLERVVEQVRSYMENVKIGLLIGTNRPRAIEPRHFVASSNGGPFAVLTFAGWTIMGPLYMSDDVHQKDQFSQEDKRFMEKMWCDTKYVDGHYEIPLPLTCI